MASSTNAPAIFPRDPRFADKAAPILDLYARGWQGDRLYPGDYVVCADEKLIPSAAPQARAHVTATQATSRRSARPDDYGPARGHFPDAAAPAGRDAVRMSGTARMSRCAPSVVLLGLLVLASAAGAVGVPTTFPRIIAITDAKQHIVVGSFQTSFRAVGGTVRVRVRVSVASNDRNRVLVIAAGPCTGGSMTSPLCRPVAKSRVNVPVGGTHWVRRFTIALPPRNHDAIRVTLTESTHAIPFRPENVGGGGGTAELLLNGGTWRYHQGTEWGIVTSPTEGITLSQIKFNSRTYAWSAHRARRRPRPHDDRLRRGNPAVGLPEHNEGRRAVRLPPHAERPDLLSAHDASGARVRRGVRQRAAVQADRPAPHVGGELATGRRRARGPRTRGSPYFRCVPPKRKSPAPRDARPQRTEAVA